MLARRLVPVVAVGGIVVTVACGGAPPAPANSPSTGDGPSSSGGEGAAASAAPAGPPKAVDCGDFTTCAIVSDGAVRCWGKDKGGELGDGAGVDRAKSGVVEGLTRVKKVALAAQFACALLEDKTVKCWGTGRIANDGKVVKNAKPTAVANVRDADDLVASGAVACARMAGGVECWGADASTIGHAPKGAFKQIAAGFTHVCGIDGGGVVSCWGSGDWGVGPFAKPGIAGAAFVTSGDRHACAITKDKKVLCWGSNDAGQLGTKPDVDVHKKPIEVPGVRGATSLVSGEASTCAIVEDGVTCWGANGEGELALGKRSSDERPAKVASLAGINEMCFGSTFGCALKQDKIVCWGSNAFGQLGDGSKERRLSPVPVAW